MNELIMNIANIPLEAEGAKPSSVWAPYMFSLDYPTVLPQLIIEMARQRAFRERKEKAFKDLEQKLATMEADRKSVV